MRLQKQANKVEERNEKIKVVHSLVVWFKENICKQCCLSLKLNIFLIHMISS